MRTPFMKARLLRLIALMMIGGTLIACCKKERIILDMSKDLVSQGVESNLGSPENLGTKEALGRWTEHPVSYIKLNRALPSKIIIKIDFRHANPKYVGRKFKIRFGGDETSFEGALKEERYVLFFKEVPKDLRTIEIISPIEEKKDNETQQASEKGIFIESIRIEEDIHDKGLLCNILNP